MGLFEDTPRERRSIRSFVRRTGRLTASQQKAIDELWPATGIPYENAPLDFDTVFGRKAQRVLEIGFGNGDTLVELASEMPDVDFLGVEVHEPGIGHCLIAMREACISNLRLACHDALEVMENQLPPASIDRINLYFPDPWPKKRHHKRRIVAPPFLDLCHRVLLPGGRLHIATDWENYAEHIDAVLGERNDFERIAYREHDGDAPLERPGTKFERRGMRHGHRIHDWIFVSVQ